MCLLLILAGFLLISVGGEPAPSGEKVESTGNAEDIVMLEIDVGKPVKRSPLQASTVYGSSPSQYVIRHGDDAQELSPEYLSLLQRYTEAQTQAYAAPASSPAPSQRAGPLPGYAKEQQQLQQAYYNFRKPTVVPPRPRAQLHAQALAQAEAVADAQYRVEISQSPRLSAGSSHAPPAYQAPYTDSKLGTFEQELLQLVSANQAQEFKIQAAPQQSKRILAQPEYATQYSQQLLNYPAQYGKESVALADSPTQLPEQYHIETTAPRYQQPHRAPIAYRPTEQPIQTQYQTVRPVESPVYRAKAVKEFRPSARYYPEENSRLKAIQRAEAEAIARAQAQAEAQALAYQKVAQASHNKHQQDAFEQIRIVNERHRQQSALESIERGAQLSEAGREHLEEQLHPKDPEAAYRARLKAQAAAETAEARRLQEASEYKAHADAILKLQAQQQAHLKAQEDAHRNALNFERNQLRAQAQAQAIAQAQAEALYKAHQQARAKANSEAQAAAKAQAEARKIDPDNTPVVQYLLPNNTPLPSPNSYLTSDQLQKYQTSGSSYVPRSAPKSQATAPEAEQTYARPPVINQPRPAHKRKIVSANSQSAPIYAASESALPKKSPVKSLTIEEVGEPERLDEHQRVVHIPATKGQRRLLTQEELSALINAGYTVTPIPDTVKPTATDSAYIGQHVSSTATPATAAYYSKKRKNGNYPIARLDYAAYEEARKSGQILKEDQGQAGGASEKVAYLIPIEPIFGTKQPPLTQNRAKPLPLK